jgi:hypothetical protein
MAGTGKRYAEGQIIAILKEAKTVKTVGEVLRRHGVTPHTYYREGEVRRDGRQRGATG